MPRLFVWQAWFFQHLRLALRGRRATFGTSIDVGGSLVTKGDYQPSAISWDFLDRLGGCQLSITKIFTGAFCCCGLR